MLQSLTPIESLLLYGCNAMGKCDTENIFAIHQRMAMDFRNAFYPGKIQLDSYLTTTG